MVSNIQIVKVELVLTTDLISGIQPKTCLKKNIDFGKIE